MSNGFGVPELPAFWATFIEGGQYCDVSTCYSEEVAKSRAHTVARENPGSTVHLMKIESVGSVVVPTTVKPICTGVIRSGMPT